MFISNYESFTATVVTPTCVAAVDDLLQAPKKYNDLMAEIALLFTVSHIDYYYLASPSSHRTDMAINSSFLLAERPCRTTNARERTPR